MIIKGDCIKEMKKLKENSVDAIITDPPYGLEFMGKEWDKLWDKRNKDEQENEGVKTFLRAGKNLSEYKAGIEMQQFHNSWAIACLRVLKPGGFLLAMGGTRTYHRLVCGIEDAGFEIRDTIMWLYGSGFPKSLNIGKQIDKLNGKRQEEFIALGNYIKEQRLKLKLSTIQVAEIGKFYGNINHGGAVANWEKGSNVSTKEQWIILKEILKLDNKFDYIIEREEAEREVIGKAKNQIGKYKEGSSEWVTNKGIYRDDKSLELMETAPATLEAKQWEGWGTALKPACEPIVVARKPLSEKNVALNVLKWGTGGINIDECRIGNETIKSSGGRKESVAGVTKNYNYGFNAPHKPLNTEHQGRFPSNIILDEEAGKMLDEQSGITKSTTDNSKHKDKKGKSWFTGNQIERTQRGDIGGASRFFYCPKASNSERNFGCEDMEQKDSRKEDGSSKSLEIFSNQYTESSGNPTGRGITSKRANNHPTVKPIKLMEYLIKLVTKPGAKVLDPFVGSGTTLIACIKLGRIPLGIEKEPEYIEIAKKRLQPYKEQTKLNFLKAKLYEK